MLNPTWLAATLAASVAVVGGVTVYATTTGATSTPSATTSSSSTGTASSAPSAAGPGGGNNGNGGGNGAGGNAGHPIAVTWTIDAPLVLGKAGTLAARIDNQNNQAIDVQKVTVAVNSSSKPGCDKTWLTVGSFNGSSPVPANSARTVNLSITLEDRSGNQDSCKAAKFNLTVTATAVQA